MTTTVNIADLVGTNAYDLVGLSEIAERTNRKRTSVHNLMTRRADFPEPIVVLAMGPVWVWDEVKTFFEWGEESAV